MVEKMDEYFEKKLSQIWDRHPASLLGRKLGNGAPSRANSRYGQIWTNNNGIIIRADVMGYGNLTWVSGLPEKLSTEIPALFPSVSPLVCNLGETDRFVDSTLIDVEWQDVGTDRTDPNPRIHYSGSTRLSWVREAFELAGFPPPPEEEVSVCFDGEVMFITYAYVEDVIWAYKADKFRTFCKGHLRGCKVGPLTASVWEIPGPFLKIENWGSSQYGVSTSRDADGMWNK